MGQSMQCHLEGWGRRRGGVGLLQVHTVMEWTVSSSRRSKSISPLGRVRDAPARRLPAESHCCLQLLPLLREGSAGDNCNASSNCLKTFISKWTQTQIRWKISGVQPYEIWTLGNYLSRNASLQIRLISAKLPQELSQCDDVPFFFGVLSAFQIQNPSQFFSSGAQLYY